MAPEALFKACNRPTSSIFSSNERGSPPPGKRPKRVPPVPKAQDGIAIWKSIIDAAKILEIYQVGVGTRYTGTRTDERIQLLLNLLLKSSLLNFVAFSFVD